VEAAPGGLVLASQQVGLVVVVAAAAAAGVNLRDLAGPQTQVAAVVVELLAVRAVVALSYWPIPGILYQFPELSHTPSIRRHVLVTEFINSQLVADRSRPLLQVYLRHSLVRIISPYLITQLPPDG
jgi:hypothetical protein